VSTNAHVLGGRRRREVEADVTLEGRA